MKIALGLVTLSVLALACKPRNFNESDSLSGPNGALGFSLGGMQAPAILKSANFVTKYDLKVNGDAIVSSTSVVTDDSGNVITSLHACSRVVLVQPPELRKQNNKTARIAYQIQINDPKVTMGAATMMPGGYIQGNIDKTILVGDGQDCKENVQFKNNAKEKYDQIIAAIKTQLQAVKQKSVERVNTILRNCPDSERRIAWNKQGKGPTSAVNVQGVWLTVGEVAEWQCQSVCVIPNETKTDTSNEFKSIKMKGGEYVLIRETGAGSPRYINREDIQTLAAEKVCKK